MDTVYQFWQKVKLLSNVDDMAQERLKQVGTEEVADYYLEGCVAKCPTVTTNYLLRMRAWNRKFVKDMRKVDIADVPQKYKEHLDMKRNMDTYLWGDAGTWYDDVATDNCEKRLPTLIKKIDDILTKKDVNPPSNPPDTSHMIPLVISSNIS